MTRQLASEQDGLIITALPDTPTGCRYGDQSSRGGKQWQQRLHDFGHFADPSLRAFLGVAPDVAALGAALETALSPA